MPAGENSPTLKGEGGKHRERKMEVSPGVTEEYEKVMEEYGKTTGLSDQLFFNDWY